MSDITQASASSKSLDGLLSVGRTVSFVLGGVVLTLAALKASIGWDVTQLLDVAQAMFGPVFIALYAALVITVLVGWLKGQGAKTLANQDPWWEAGIQAASGIATLALTFTLLGISIGIGSLAGTELTPETVPGVISTLTEQFGRAFMTTIVGLPTSHALRALLAVNATQRRKRYIAAQQQSHKAQSFQAQA